ncbi:MAG: FtsX-like permease family protein [Lentisphaeria bacterium]|nr:FtsX-like permease family protein [Lentisphaeria bacterium]
MPWSTAFAVSWSSVRRRFFRSLVAMAGVVMAIALLTYMQVMNNITKALVAANDTILNVRLQEAGVDIYAADSGDRMMMLLITLSLMACLVGILNSMLMSVTERIKEIGTLKCLGALDSFIVRIYFIESSLQGVCGTLLGMVGGLTVAVVMAFANYNVYVFHFFPFMAAAKSSVVSVLIGSLLSVAASILPAYLAAKKQPVDAMRVEE